MSSYPPPPPPIPPQGPYSGPPQPPQGYPPPPPGYGQQPLAYATPGAAQGALCPQCRQMAGKKVSYTWWGGFLGPKIFNHHKCQACGYQFNGTTGKSNSTAITLWLVISGVIGLFIGILIVMARRF